MDTSNKKVNKGMKLFHKVWGEVTVLRTDSQFIFIKTKEDVTKKLLLTSIGTYLFYSMEEMHIKEDEEKQKEYKKVDDFRKRYRLVDDVDDEYKEDIEQFEDLDWSTFKRNQTIISDDSESKLLSNNFLLEETETRKNP